MGYTGRVALRITDEMKQALQAEQGGPVEVFGAESPYVLMSLEVYRQMLGVGSDADFADSVAALKRGMEDVRAGRTRPLADSLDQLGRK